MSKRKIAITIDAGLVKELDLLVEGNIYPSRSRAIESALAFTSEISKRRRLLTELSKLNPDEEIELAEEFMNADGVKWLEY